MNTRKIVLFAALVSLALPVAAQAPVQPFDEDFELATPLSSASSSCPNTATGTFPPGWSVDPNNGAQWTVFSGSTTSSSTGPSGDHTTGSGNYVFIETSSSCNGGLQAMLLLPPVDVSSLAAPAIEFYTHMYGATMGSLAVEQKDAAGNWVALGSLSGDQGDRWLFVGYRLLSGLSTAELRFVGTTGSSFTSDMAIDDVTIRSRLAYPWHTNSSRATLELDGLGSSPTELASKSGSIYTACRVGSAPLRAGVRFATDTPSAGYEVAISAYPAVEAFQPGNLVLADGQQINWDLTQPYMTLFNLSFPSFPGANLPGALSASFEVDLSFPAPVMLTMQSAHADPSAAFGVALSSALQIEAADTPVPSAVAGPTSGSGSVLLDVTAAPTCWTTQGVLFAGTRYSEIGVMADGRVVLGGTDTSSSPTLSLALGEPAFVGFWTDLDVGSGGSITIENPTGERIRVRYDGVPYSGQSATANSFSIEFDAASGQITLDGLSGIVDNPTLSSNSDNQFLGLSPGSQAGAVDPGAVGFAAGTVGGAANALDMVYDFFDRSTATTNRAASLAGGTQTVVFYPSVSVPGAYDWAAF